MKKTFFWEVIENKMNDYASPMDITEGWHSLKKKKKNNKRKYLFLLLFMALATTGLAVWFSKSATPISMSKEEIVVRTTDAIRTNEATKVLQSPVHPSAPTKAYDAVSANSIQLPKSTSEVSTSAPIYSHKNEELQTKGYMASNKRSNQRKTKPNAKSLLEDKEEDKTSEQDPNTISITVKNEKQDTESVGLLANLQNESGLVNSQMDNSIESKTTNISAVNFTAIKPLPILLTKVSTLNNLPILPATVTAENRKKTPSWGLYIGGGLASSHQTFKARDSSAADLQNFRNNIEKPLETYTTEVGLSYAFSPKTHINFGLNYARAFNRFDYDFLEQKDVTLTNVLLRTIVYQPSGEVEQIRGDTIVKQTTTTNGVFYQTYSSLTMQVSLSHTIAKMHRVNLAIVGGFDWNINTSIQGKVLNAPKGQALSDIKNAEIYKKSFGIGGLIGVDVSYPITNRFHLQIKPRFNYTFSNITNTNYSFGIRSSIVMVYRWVYIISYKNSFLLMAKIIFVLAIKQYLL